ncbi:MAG: glycosyltransferase family 2 protein [Chitinophagaceae bacterium]|nr:glycosyltransferase family 2 protein [Chitinophagaceae bacterium]
MSSPFFSVVVPCYNRASLLPHSIGSIQSQTFTGFEIILVDDGSTDNTKEVILNFCKEDRRIRYLYQENSERGAARNNGIKNSAGEFVVLFDSDDEMKKDYLQRLYQFIQNYPSYNFYSAKYNFLEGGIEKPSTMKPIREGGYGIDLVLKGNPFASNFCIRKSNPQLKLFCEDRSLATTEDWIFLVENLRNDSIAVFDFIGLYMHQHEGRSMQQNQILIERRIKATEYLLQTILFSEAEKKILWAYTHFFCSVHAYLDHNRKQSIQFLKKSVELNGWSIDKIKAFIKYLFGRAVIKRTKRTGVWEAK